MIFQNNKKSFPKINKIGEIIEADRSISKIFVLAFFGIILSFFSGYFLKLFILESRLDFLLFSFLIFLGFLIIFLLKTFFIKSNSSIALIIFLESLGLLATFYDYLSVNIALGVAASFLLFLLANFSGRYELENMLKIKFWQVAKKVLPKAILALAVFISVAYVNVSGITDKKFFISSSVFEKIIAPVANIKVFQNFLPGFDLSLPVGELIQNLAKNQVEQNTQMQLLTDSEKKQTTNQIAKELEKHFSEFLGNPINPKIKTTEVFYNAMLNKFFKLPDNIKPYIPIAIGFLIFLTIISLTLPICWIASVLAYFVYEICLLLGFSVIILEGKSKEMIILK